MQFLAKDFKSFLMKDIDRQKGQPGIDKISTVSAKGRKEKGNVTLWIWCLKKKRSKKRTISMASEQWREGKCKITEQSRDHHTISCSRLGYQNITTT